MKLLIACPVQNREWMLPDYLLYLYNLEYDKKDITIYWVVNNSTDHSLKILKEFKKDFGAEYNDIIIEVYNNPKYKTDTRNKITRRGSTYYWLAELRNKLLDKCVELDCDYLLSSDCDILLRYDTVTQLLSHNNPVVSALIYNGYMLAPKTPWMYPNILKWSPSASRYFHIRNKWIKQPWNVPNGKTIPVDFTGACILIRKDICSKARYAHFVNGEDEPFCKSARKYCTILCDLSLLNIHIMSQNFLKRPDNIDLYLTEGWK